MIALLPYAFGPFSLNRLPHSFTSMQVVRRHEKEFGSRNYRFMVGKVEFVAVDAQTLDGKQEGI